MNNIDKTTAQKIIEKSFEKGRELKLNPLMVVVLDNRGAVKAVPGGVLIRNSNKDIIGSIGISGDTSDNDESAAIYGIESVNLIPDIG